MDEFPEGFDLEAMLAAIPGEAAVGVDLREDYAPSSLYYRLRDARSEARAAERAADAEAEASAPPAEWGTVEQLASEALLTRSKDLEIAAWLTEALLRREGLVGLAAGCRLMTGLAENFWDALFPLPDEDGVATRVAPVAGLNGIGGEGTLSQPLRKIALFERADGTPLSYWQYEQSAEVAGIGDQARQKARLDAGVLPFETVEAEARRAGAAFAVFRRHSVAAAESWKRLSQVLDERAGADGPPTSAVSDLLDKMSTVAARFAAPEAVEAEAPATAAVGEEPGGATAAAPVAVGVAPAAAVLAGREEALRGLAQIAEFFRRTEPLSPLAYTLQEALRRARLTWPELLEEIVPDTGSRAAILTSLGIRPPPPPE
jgi:type VI secretion system protein ImpA